MAITRQSTKKNYILQLLYQFLILTIPLVIFPYLTRTIGETGLGVYTYSDSIARYFVIFAMLGISRYGQRTIASNLNDEISLRKSFWSLYTVHALFSIIAIFLYILLVIFFVNNDREIFYIQTIFVISALFDLTWFFQGIEYFKSIVVRNTIIKILECALIFIAVRESDDLWIYALIVTAGELIGQLLLFAQAVRLVKPIRFTRDEAKEHVKPLFTFAIVVVAVALYTVFDKTLIGLFSSVEEVAFYEYSHKIINVPLTILCVIGTVFYPRVCRLVAENSIEGQKKYFESSTILTCFMAFGAIFGLLAIANPFSIVYFGEDFAVCGGIIKLFTPLIFIVGFGDILRTQYLIPNKRDAEFVKCHCINAVINIVISLILIPRIGVYGAIIGTMAAETFGFIYQMRLSKEVISFGYLLKEMAPFALIGLAMYVAITMIQSLMSVSVTSLLLQILIGMAIYCILSLVYIYSIKQDTYMNKQLKNSIKGFSRLFPRWILPKWVLRICLLTIFRRRQGYNFDINSPRSFNEKIQWYKLNYFCSEMTECVDKLEFKNYAKKRLGRDISPKTLGVWTDVDDLEKDWKMLPGKFCLKSNCMAENAGVIIVMDKANFSFEDIKPRIKKWLIKRYTTVNSTNKAYRNVVPKIFAEEFIGNSDSLVDYKFYCFDGKPYCLNATTRVFQGEAILDAGIAYYDNEWNVLEGNVAGRIKKVIDKPARLDEMMEIAARLSEGFPFVRVDLYCTDERIYTGEVEFYPGGGFGKYEPFEFDLELGGEFILPEMK